MPRPVKYRQDKARARALQFFNETKIGEFKGEYGLKWIRPDWFIYTPDKDDPFRYVTADKRVVITPEQMETNGGSIPRIMWPFTGFSPMGFLPAYLIHDWEFLAHQIGQSDRTFREVNLTLAECIYTLMRTNEAIKTDPSVVHTIHVGVSSPIGRDIWDD